MNKLRIATIICCIMFFVSCEKGSDSVDISGIVTDIDSSTPLIDCSISLDGKKLETATNSSGHFSIEGVSNGIHTIVAERSGYARTEKQIVANSNNRTVSIEMKCTAPYSLQSDNIDFGDATTTISLKVYNNSDNDCDGNLISLPSWINTGSPNFYIPKHSYKIVELKANRSVIPIGNYQHTFNVVCSREGSDPVELPVTAKIYRIQAGLPAVTINDEVGGITSNSLTPSAKITATGGTEIIRYGFCWATDHTPTIDDTNVNLGKTSQTISFSHVITGLLSETTYKVRAYAQNADGIAYSEVITVKTDKVKTDIWDGSTASKFAGGSGTIGDPYKIATGAQMSLMRGYTSSHFVLVNDIDLNDINWKPGDLSGTFDGQGFTIKNLHGENIEYGGLFDTLNGTIMNLTIKGVKINIQGSIGIVTQNLMGKGKIENVNVILTPQSYVKGGDKVGGIIGNSDYSLSGEATICENCTVISEGNTTAITGENYVGAICGYIRNGYNNYIKNCKAEVNITATNNIGGIIGYGKESIIQNCSYKGDITGGNTIGGIAGYITSTTSTYSIVACMARTNIKSKTNGEAGGLCGDMQYAACLACYTDGTISTSSSYISPFIAYSSIGATAELCYSTMTDASRRSIKGSNFNATTRNSFTANSTTSIATLLKNTGSKYLNYYNFDNTWKWTGTIDGVSYTHNCPKLYWE